MTANGTILRSGSRSSGGEIQCESVGALLDSHELGAMSTSHEPLGRDSRRHECLADERGTAVVGVILMTPIVLLLLWFAVLAGRMVTTQQDVISASRDGARAAAVVATPGNAVTKATAAVEGTLAGAGVACQNLTVQVDTASFGAGGQVTVTVRCEVSIQDVVSGWAPGTKVIEASSTAVIDTYRGGDQ